MAKQQHAAAVLNSRKADSDAFRHPGLSADARYPKPIRQKVAGDPSSQANSYSHGPTATRGNSTRQREPSQVPGNSPGPTGRRQSCTMHVSRRGPASPGPEPARSRTSLQDYDHDSSIMIITTDNEQGVGGGASKHACAMHVHGRRHPQPAGGRGDGRFETLSIGQSGEARRAAHSRLRVATWLRPALIRCHVKCEIDGRRRREEGGGENEE